jgi:flavodoxin
MDVWIVYDSVFGNTEKVAQVMGEALAAEMAVEVLKVGEADPQQVSGLQILIVGSPTRAFSPTPDTKSFLNRIPRNALQGIKVAAFDTRVSIEEVDSAILNLFVKIFGYAAKPIAKRLERRGGSLVLPPEGFIVGGTEGPLGEGERERAAAWAKKVADA